MPTPNIVLLSIQENVLVFISGFGIMQAVFLAALLIFHPRSDRFVNVFLALYISALAIPMMLPIAQRVFNWQIMVFIEPFLTLIGPMLYLYVRSHKETINFQKAWPHFVLFFLCIPLAVYNYRTIGLRFPPSTAIPTVVAKNPSLLLPISIRLVQRVIYYILASRALTSYQRSIRHLFSDTSRIDLRWVRWLVNGNLFLIFVTVFFYVFMIRYPEYFDWWVLLPSVIVSLYIYMATIRGVTQLTLWQVQPGVSKEKVEEKMQEAEEIEALNELPAKSLREASLGSAKMDEVAARIIVLMEKDKLYQEPELTLLDLATKLQLPSYQVSQAINLSLNKTFYDLINRYRVDEAKRLLLDARTANYTILSVGFEAGFNSKTTFNTVFKKITGLTPTDFRKREVHSFSLD